MNKFYKILAVLLSISVASCSTVNPWDLDKDLQLIGNSPLNIKVTTLGGIHRGSSDSTLMPAGNNIFVPIGIGSVQTLDDETIKGYSASLAQKISTTAVFNSSEYSDSYGTHENEISLFFMETYNGASAGTVKFVVDFTLMINGEVVRNKLFKVSGGVSDVFKCPDCNAYTMATYKLDKLIYDELQAWLNTEGEKSA